MPTTTVPSRRSPRPSTGPTSSASRPVTPSHSPTAARPARPPRAWRGKAGPRGTSKPGGAGAAAHDDAAAHDILFQKFFKSVGPRTYAAQVKRARNGNHYLVLTEGKRDDAGEVRKTRLFVYSEDFAEFFRLAKSAAEFIKAHPVPPDVVAKREKYWARQAVPAATAAPGAPTPRPTSGVASTATITTARSGAADGPRFPQPVSLAGPAHHVNRDGRRPPG